MESAIKELKQRNILFCWFNTTKKPRYICLVKFKHGIYKEKNL